MHIYTKRKNARDAYWLDLAESSIYTTQNNNKLSVQALGLELPNTSMHLNAKEKGTYQIQLDEIVKFDNETVVGLYDKEVGKYFNLSDLENYKFYTEEVTNDARFEVLINPTDIIFEEENIVTDLDAKEENQFVVRKNGITFHQAIAIEQFNIFNSNGQLMIHRENLNNENFIPFDFKYDQLYIIQFNQTLKKVVLIR